MTILRDTGSKGSISHIFGASPVGTEPRKIPGCRLKAPLGLSLLRKRGLVGACLPPNPAFEVATNWKLFIVCICFIVFLFPMSRTQAKK